MTLTSEIHNPLMRTCKYFGYYSSSYNQAWNKTFSVIINCKSVASGPSFRAKRNTEVLWKVDDVQSEPPVDIVTIRSFHFPSKWLFCHYRAHITNNLNIWLNVYSNTIYRHIEWIIPLSIDIFVWQIMVIIKKREERAINLTEKKRSTVLPKKTVWVHRWLHGQN